MKRQLLFLLLLLGLSCRLSGQSDITTEPWADYLDGLDGEAVDEEQLTAFYTDLSYLSEHRLDLNQATAGQLRRLPFLSDRQIGALLTYRERYGRMATLYELKNIPEIDFQTISRLLPFVYIGEYTVDNRLPTVDNLLKYGSNKLLLRYGRCLQQRKGYLAQPDSVLQKYPNRQYLGEPFYHSLRYSHTFGDRLQAGLIAEKDAGEPFWNRHHKGYDYYSAHLLIRNIGWLKTLAIGDYKASFGQGLVLSHDFNPGRSALPTQQERRNNGFRRHYSTDEYRFFRGAAATVQHRDFSLSLFHSDRRLDATPAGERTVSAIKTDGLHRLPRDVAKRNILPMRTYGGNVRYATADVSVGLTALAHTFVDYTLQPEARPYNRFAFRGTKNANVSVDYLLRKTGFQFFGETALGRNGAVATLNALRLTPVSYASLLILGRYYDRRYQAFFGNAFSQNTRVENEQGLYLGMQFRPFRYWTVSLSADAFRFPWLKYGVDAPSGGQEYLAQVEYTAPRRPSFLFRYRYRRREKNAADDGSPVLPIRPYHRHRMSLRLYAATGAVRWKTNAEGSLGRESGRSQSYGLLLSQSVGWQKEGAPFLIDLYGAWFRTDDYDTRLMSYERNLLYVLDAPQLYGRGMRLALVAGWEIFALLSLSLKLSHTYHARRDPPGDDPEELDGNQKTDLAVMLHWQF